MRFDLFHGFFVLHRVPQGVDRDNRRGVSLTDIQAMDQTALQNTQLRRVATSPSQTRAGSLP